MTRTIQILQDSLINKIAAGEVLENPTSVVKELTENSIDAKAENIHIEIKGSGLLSIKVEDDGIGMNREDAVLCFERHATSKIKKFEDLININSMGFRGEALASIAAVSKVELKTSRDSMATLVKIEGSKLISVDEIARTRGTTVEVKSLFYNVPVRKKFQRAFSYINSEIIKTVTCLALSKPNIGFSLDLNGRLIFAADNNNEDIKTAFNKRIKQMLSGDFSSSVTDVDFDEDCVKILGSVGNPSACKKTKSSQYLIINDRVVTCHAISKFMKDAYSTRIAEDDFPIFVLNIKVPSNFIDVNVHPQKKEIRLTELVLIREAVKKAVDKAFIKELDKEKTPVFFENEISFAKTEENSCQESAKENIFEKFEKQLIFENFNPLENIFKDFLQTNNFVFLDAKLLKSHLDLKDDEEILIIDLSAIYSYLLFEKIKTKKNISRQQNLLIPITIDLHSGDIYFLENNLLNLSDLGFEIRVVGKNAVVIDAMPDIIANESVKDVFFLILEDLKHFDKTDAVDKIHEKKIAREISVLSKTKKFSRKEAINLLNIFIDAKNVKFDFLGNPLFIALDKVKIEKLFKK